MTALHKILNTLTCLLAVVALVCSVLMYERRQELTSRADMLADTVADVARTLDADSGTRYADLAHVDPIPDPGRSDGVINGGSLGAENFHRQLVQGHSVAGFQSILEEVQQLARDMQQQRNALSVALGDMGQVLESNINKDGFQTIDGGAYREAVEALTAHTERVAGRERSISAAVVEASLAMGHPIRADALKNFDDYETAMTSFSSRAASLNQRAEDYADVLWKAPIIVDAYDFRANPSRISQTGDYQTELNEMLGDFATINNRLHKLKRMKAELEETKDQLADYVVALDDSEDAIRTLKMRVANVQGQYDVLYTRLRECEAEPEDAAPSLDVRAQVVRIDHEYRYLIIDLGSRDNLAPNALLNIGRDNSLVCKVTVSRVLDEYAVCEVLPEFRLSEVKTGDRVVLR